MVLTDEKMFDDNQSEKMQDPSGHAQADNNGGTSHPSEPGPSSGFDFFQRPGNFWGAGSPGMPGPPPYMHNHRPETVSLEQQDNRHGHPGHHHHHWQHHPDPPLPPMPPVVPMAPFAGPGMRPEFFNWMGQNFRNVANDLAASFTPEAHGGRGFGRRGGRGGLGFRGGFRGRGARHNHHHHEEEEIHPNMDIITSEGGGYIVNIELPGLTKKQVDISVKNSVLTISGEFITKPFDTTEEFIDITDDETDGTLSNDMTEKPTDGFALRERRHGKFKRSITLPAWVRLENVKATMAEGVLTLVFEKPSAREPSPPQKISIL